MWVLCSVCILPAVYVLRVDHSRNNLDHGMEDQVPTWHEQTRQRDEFSSGRFAAQLWNGP